jgi:hypothetical protein
MEGRAVGYNFERDPPKYHPRHAWFNLVKWFNVSSRFFCKNVLSVKLYISSIFSYYAYILRRKHHIKIFCSEI